jgi:S1-C subfamily serine protease
MVQRVMPSVVSLDVTSANSGATGSGVVIDQGGYIITNNHVVTAAGGSPDIKVYFSDGSTAAAQVVGTDPLTDLAVVKVDKTDLTVVSLGDVNTLSVGDPVVAIGSPLGLRETVTSGIVSALNRAVRVGGENGNPDVVVSALQTDAAINPGNSGGALVDSAGALVGITSSIATLSSSSASGSIGLGFAIPVDTARDVAQQLISSGKAVHATMGLSMRDVTDGAQDGAYVAQVIPRGPAARAGITEGDVITSIDGAAMTGADDVTLAVNAHKPGDTLSVTYIRAAASTTVKVTLDQA